MPDEKFYPAAPPEKNVWGRFEWFQSDDGPYDVEASKAADKKVPLRIITLRARTANSDGDQVIPVKPFNQAQLVARFPEAWRAFNGEQIDPGGTSLDELGLNPQQRLNLQMFGIHNVDMLASLSDQGCGALGFGWRKIRDEAKGLLEAKKDEHTAKLLAKVEQMDEPAKRKPGRPKKTDAVQTAA